MGLFFGSAFLVLAALAAAYYFWAKRVRADIAEGAEFEWNRLQERDPKLLEGLDRPFFDAIYMRTHFPRFPAYALVAAASFLAALPIVFGVLAAGLYAAEVFGLTPQPVSVAEQFFVEDGRMRILTAAPPEAAYYWVRDLGGFYYFFGVVGAWLLIVWFFISRFYRSRPGYLRDEILRARGAMKP